MTDTLLDLRPGTYTIDPARSSVAFTATHVLGLKPVHGTMPVTGGTVTLAEETRRSSVSAEIDATGWRTDDPKRDRDVKGKRFLDTDRHPVIGFRSTRVVRAEDGWRVAGVLAVRGGSTEVELLVTDLAPAGEGCTFTASARVDRVAAGVATGRAIIGRHIDVTLTVTVA